VLVASRLPGRARSHTYDDQARPEAMPA
jgi:hypothetical protein